MRVPKIEHYENSNKIETININPNRIDMEYIIMTDKDKLKLITDIERYVRRSLEYKQYIRFLRDEIDMTECAFFENVNNKNRNSKISIEIHHEPIDLFTITQIVVDKWIDLGIPINPILISKEVMELHYKNHIGLIPLSVTVHQLYHDGKIFIPLQYVYGKYISFIEEYWDYISEETRSILQTKMDISKKIVKMDTSILETKYTYVNVDGFILPSIIEEST